VGERSPTLVAVARVGDFAVTSEGLPGGGTVFRVDGDLDLASAPALEELLGQHGFDQRLVIDLEQCTFLDSSAVRVLVAAARDSEAAGGSLALVATDPGILRVLEISGVDTILGVHPSLDDAL
jgi:anti-sigma B factor antagonist